MDKQHICYDIIIVVCSAVERDGDEEGPRDYLSSAACYGGKGDE